GRYSALAGLREHIRRQRIRNSIDAFCHRVRCRGRQNESVVCAVVERSDRRCTGRGVAEDTHRFRKGLPIHANDLACRTGDEKIDLVQFTDNIEALLEEVTRARQCPSPTRLFDLGHNGASKRRATRSCKLTAVPGMPRLLMAFWTAPEASAATMEAAAPL